MHEKREISKEKRKIASYIKRSRMNDIYTRIKHLPQLSLHGLGSFLYHPPFWKLEIKQLEGHHGSHVGIYFEFLRWCLVCNLFLSVIWVAFVISPHAYYVGFKAGLADMNPSPVPEFTEYNSRDTFVGLVTGGGTINHTAYFLGAYYIPYTNVSLANDPWNPDTNPDTNYQLPLAYLLTGGAFIVVSFVFIFFGLFKEVRRSAVAFELGEYKMSKLCFGTYDHRFTNEESILAHQKEIAREMQESLGNDEMRETHEQFKAEHPIKFWVRRFTINAVVIVILTFSIWLMIYVVEEYGLSDGEISPSIPNFNMAPLFFKMAQHLDLRCVLVPAPWVGPSTLGAGAKTRLESRIKKFTPHCVCRPRPPDCAGQYTPQINHESLIRSPFSKWRQNLDPR